MSNLLTVVIIHRHATYRCPNLHHPYHGFLLLTKSNHLASIVDLWPFNYYLMGSSRILHRVGMKDSLQRIAIFLLENESLFAEIKVWPSLNPYLFTVLFASIFLLCVFVLLPHQVSLWSWACLYGLLKLPTLRSTFQIWEWQILAPIRFNQFNPTCKWIQNHPHTKLI